MVIGAFPIAKLGALLIKQISKPIANALKTQAKSSPVFSKYVCMPPAQFYNWCEIKAKMWILNLGKPVNIAVLNEEMAIELGANLLGETIIFIIASVILVLEYNRSSRREAAKEAAKIQEIEIINTNLKELFMKTEEHGAQIKHLLRVVNELEADVVKKPWIPKKKSEEMEKGRITSKNDSPTGFIPIPVPSVEDKEPQDSKVESSLPSFKGLALNSSMMTNIKPLYLQEFVIKDVDNLKDNKNTHKTTGSIKNDKKQDENYSGFLLHVISSIEKDIFKKNDSERSDGVLIDALNYLYKDVYKIPLS